jgi:hypothetical protein
MHSLPQLPVHVREACRIAGGVLVQGVVVGTILLLGAGLIVFVLEPLQRGGKNKE